MKLLSAVLSVLGCAGLVEELLSHLLLLSAWHAAIMKVIMASLYILAPVAMPCT